jgi:hypothetical protein
MSGDRATVPPDRQQARRDRQLRQRQAGIGNFVHRGADALDFARAAARRAYSAASVAM